MSRTYLATALFNSSGMAKIGDMAWKKNICHFLLYLVSEINMFVNENFCFYRYQTLSLKLVLLNAHVETHTHIYILINENW